MVDGVVEVKGLVVCTARTGNMLPAALQVLYNLCEWPTRKRARLAVIGIANTLDLPERLLPRIASRLGGRRVVFQPYKRDQLKAIVSQRLADAGVSATFDERAITFAASKVSDLRLARAACMLPCASCPAALSHEGLLHCVLEDPARAAKNMCEAACVNVASACLSAQWS
jgi:hypothetical protein